MINATAYFKPKRLRTGQSSKGLRTLLHRTNSGYYPFLKGNVYQVAATTTIIDDLPPGHTLKFEVVSKSKNGEIRQTVDLEVLSGGTVVKRYKVKPLGDRANVKGLPSDCGRPSASVRSFVLLGTQIVLSDSVCFRDKFGGDQR